MAAGNWLTNAGLGDANQALQTIEMQVALSEARKNALPFTNPVMLNILARDEGIGNLTAALGISSSFAALGQGKMTATAEGSDVALTNFDEDSVTLTPARRAFARAASDFGRSYTEGILRGEISPNARALIAYEGLKVWQNTLIDLIVALASSATYNADASGVDLTWDVMQAMGYDMRDRGNEGGIMVMLSAKGVKDLAEDAVSLGGAVQMSQQVQQFITNGMNGAYVGKFFGNMDIYMNSELDTSGGDTLGIAFGPQGIQTRHQMVPLPEEAEAVIRNGMYTIEARRTGGSVTRFDTVSHNAAGIRQQVALSAITYSTT